MLALRHRFEATDKRHRIEADRRRKRDFVRQRDEQSKGRDEAEERMDDAVSAFTVAVAISTPAPPERIAEFEITLTNYETGVVKALLQNEKLLEKAQFDLMLLLEGAHVLEDGRRAFKTEDGTAVYDEFGEAVGTDVLHPNEIPDEATTWEQFQEAKAVEDALIQQRTELLEYQGKLDAAREEIAEGEISLEYLEALEADLLETMPPSVATFVNEAEAPTHAPIAASAAPLTQAQTPLPTASPVIPGPT